MKHKRFLCEQIIGILKEADAGAVVLDLRRKPGMSSATFHAWKSKYSGLKVSDAKRLGALEEESSKLKRRLADAMLENAASDSHRADPPGQSRPQVAPTITQPSIG